MYYATIVIKYNQQVQRARKKVNVLSVDLGAWWLIFCRRIFGEWSYREFYEENDKWLNQTWRRYIESIDVFTLVNCWFTLKYPKNKDFDMMVMERAGELYESYNKLGIDRWNGGWEARWLICFSWLYTQIMKFEKYFDIRTT